MGGRRYDYGYGPGDGYDDFEPKPSTSALRKRLGRPPAPVRGEGRKLAKTFWGLAWCRNLESYQDYANRLPRGRTYLRQGAVLDLAIEPGRVTALVMGSSLYTLRIEIDPVEEGRWAELRGQCAGKLDSLIDLLEGSMPDELMRAVADPRQGLFPAPREIRMDCSCPDWAGVCKHLAASLYGVALRLDAQPELLFVLRGVSPEELVDVASIGRGGAGAQAIPAEELSEIFGVLIDDRTRASAAKKKPAKKKPAKKKPAKKKPAKKKPVHFRSTRKWIEDAELRALGISRAEVRAWVREGHLLVVEGRDGYRLLPESRRRLRARASESE